MEKIVVFRTGKSHEILMALNELKAANVPTFAQEEGGGLVTAMPLTPVPGPDVSWAILVLEGHVENAREVLSTLPLEVRTNPGSWDFAPTPRAKKYWKIYIYFFIIVFGVSIVSQVLKMLKS